MLVVGLTGGIGAGKSTVSQFFARLGAEIIDADAIAREVVAEDPRVREKLVAAFGQEILASDGSLDRRELGRRAFRDEHSRRRLNDILHPPILAKTQQALEELRRRGYGGVVVVDAALLVECRTLEMVDQLVVVTAPLDLRRRRIKDSQGLSDQEIDQRMAAQLTDEEKSKLADHLIVNDGTLDGLRGQVVQVWDRLLERLLSARR
jgi:dephospho-CoA kinase